MLRTWWLCVALLAGCKNLRSDLTVDVCQPEHGYTVGLLTSAEGVVVFVGDEETGRFGTPCRGAPDASACEAELTRLRPTEPRHPRSHGPGDLVVLLTRRGVVERLDRTVTWERLAPLPPAVRAQLWLRLRYHREVLCGGRNLAETPEGVKVLTSSHDGCFGGSDSVELVRPDGSIETLAEKTYPRTCVG